MKDERAMEAASTLACTATQNHSLPFPGKLEYDTTTCTTLTCAMPIYVGAKAVVNIHFVARSVDAALFCAMDHPRAMHHDVSWEILHLRTKTP